MDEIQKVFEQSFKHLLTSSKVSFLYHENGFKLASYRENDLLVPASNTKLFHTAAALELSETEEVLPSLKVFVDGEVQNGTLKGNLILDSCGSLAFSGRYPTSLSMNEKKLKLEQRVDEFIKRLKELGVQTIDGDLKLSFNRWNGLQVNTKYNAAAPFAFNENTVDTQVSSGEIFTCPESPLKFSFKIDSAIQSQDKRADNTVFFNPQVDSKDYWRINKTDVIDYARMMLKRSLIEKGIKFNNQNLSGSIKELFEFKPKESLADYIFPINQYSDNLRAELLALQINRLVQKKATYESLTDSLKKVLGEAVKGNYEFHDGSGLSRENKCSASSIVSLLQHMSGSAHHHAYEQSLAVAAVSGTLAKRFHRTSFAGRFIGKTGTLNKVTALSGYWFKDPYTRVTLSFLGNGAENSEYWEALESFASLVK